MPARALASPQRHETRSLDIGPTRRLSRRAATLVLAVFAVVYGALEVAAYRQKSATSDEPIHLTSGYFALAKHAYWVDPSHPPLLRMWAALPLLAMTGVRTPAVDPSKDPRWAITDANYRLAHDFLYRDNDADRLLYAARFMIVLLGVLTGGLLFCWVNEWLGGTAAACALGFYCLSPNLGAHASLVTTDFGLTCFTLGTLYGLWRYCRRPSAPNLTLLAVFFSLAVVSKFSALLLWPIVIALLVIQVGRRGGMSRGAAARAVGVLAVVSVAAIWAVYGFRYGPDPASAFAFRFDQVALFRQDMPVLSAAVGWIDAHRLLPNAFTQGLLFCVESIVRADPSYLAGKLSADGWWYYFPVAFLVKTPLALLATAAAGVLVFIRRRRELGVLNEAFVAVPIAVFFGSAMMTSFDIGLRHVLPVYPFVLIIAAVAGRELLTTFRWPGRVALAGLAAFWLLVFEQVYPNTLTFFNQLAGGPANGLSYLADSNLDWGQHLKALKSWMDDRGVAEINLAYFGQADPAYYGIKCTFLPGVPGVIAGEISRPKLPGYVAISATVLSGAYLDPSWRLYYLGFQDLEPVERIGGSINVYWVEHWPESDDEALAAHPAQAAAERTLANALVGQRWFNHAIFHYRRYLARHPNRADVMTSLAGALAASGQRDAARQALERAVAVDPANRTAHLALANLLLDGHEWSEALVHAERAVALGSADALAHDTLGRALAFVGRVDDARDELQRALRLDPQNRRVRDDIAWLSHLSAGQFPSPRQALGLGAV